jgi:hypothetical protein
MSEVVHSCSQKKLFTGTSVISLAKAAGNPDWSPGAQSGETCRSRFASGLMICTAPPCATTSTPQGKSSKTLDK